MAKLIKLEGTIARPPNIIALVNYAREGIPIRGYIFNIHLDEIYGGLERAAEHFIKRTKNLSLRKNDEGILYLVGCVKGKIWPDGRRDRDIVYMPFIPSNGGIKTSPFLVKDSGVNNKSELGKGSQCRGTPNLNGDMLRIGSAEVSTWEQALNEPYPPGYFFNTLPEIPGLVYGERKIITI